MSIDTKARIAAISRQATEADMQLASLALVAVATIARNEWPEAAYVVLAETDQNDSGELWVQAVYDAEHDTIADSESFDDDPVAYHLHESNEVMWKPFVTDLSAPGRASQGEYLLDIAKVLSEVRTRPNPTIFRMLDMSTAHLPREMREDLSQYEGVIADERNYGWLLWVPEDIDKHVGECDPEDADELIPPEIVRIWRKAAEHDCQYVLIDQDASTVEDLPTYND